MILQQMSGCQRQISECCNDSLEICFLDKCDTDDVAFDDDDDKDNMYKVCLNNYQTGNSLCGTTDDGDETVWNSRYHKGKTVSCIHTNCSSIFTHLYIY